MKKLTTLLKMGRNKLTTLLIMTVILMTITYADVQLGGRGRIDNSAKTFTQIQNLHFNDNDQRGLFGLGGYSPIQIQFTRSCESINGFNSANPNNTVSSVQWRVYLRDNDYSIYGRASNVTFRNYTYGCSGTSICNAGNTPQNTETIYYLISHRGNFYAEMVTTFNYSNGTVYDSPCDYQTEIGSYSCNGGCEEYTYEEIVNKVEEQRDINEHSKNTTNILLDVVAYNLTIWEMGLWLIKVIIVLGIIIGLISLIFIIYTQIKKIQGDK